MWNYRGKILLVFFLVFGKFGFGQQFTQFSNYLLSAVGINSAYVGSKSDVEIMSSFRNQWIGLQGSPVTYFVSGHGFVKSKKIGIGGILLSDQIGKSKSTYFNISASYQIELQDYKLNLGLNSGLLNQTENFGQLKTIQPNDVVFDQDPSSFISPTLGVGAYFFGKNLFVGFSTPDIIENNTLYQKKRHYYFLLGKVFGINSFLKFKPSTLLKSTKSVPLQADLSATLIVKDLLGLGTSYRTGAGQVFYAQLFLDQNWTFSYAYDHMTNALNSIENGSHELTLIYRISRSHTTIYSPRYF